VALPRVAALAATCFGGEAIGPPTDLLIYRALVVQYDAAAGLTHQEVHRDGSLVTCVINLSERSEYTGGGTYLEALGTALTPQRGHALLQASALRHAGHFIDSGERWVLVLFIISALPTYGEHVRHLKARAQRLADDEDAAGEVRLLDLARAVCDDHDHELIYDQAVGAHERGELDHALELYELASHVSGGIDPRVATNLHAVRRTLGLECEQHEATAEEAAASAAEGAAFDGVVYPTRAAGWGGTDEAGAEWGLSAAGEAAAKAAMFASWRQR